MRREFIPYMGYQWLKIEDDSVIVGVSDEGLDELTDIGTVSLPAENETVSADEICGEIESDEGSLNLYAPVDGKIVEINSAVLENPDVIHEDPYGDGWLFRVEAKNPDDLEDLDSADDSSED